MPLEQTTRDPGGTAAFSAPIVRVAHSGRYETAVGELGDTVEVTILLQKNTAFPREERRGAAKIEIVNFDGFSCAVAGAVDAEAPRRRFSDAETMHIEGLQV
jgi:hypothetical protein